MICDMCGKDKKTVERVPSRKALIMGPFPGSMYFGSPPYYPMENRCQSCETKLSKRLERSIKDLSS